MKQNVIVVFLALCLARETSTVLTKNYENSTFIDTKNAFKLSWTYIRDVDVVLFAVEVQATGWVGFGFARKIGMMKGYDVMVAKVKNGQGFLNDRFTHDYMEPLADLQQDFNMTFFEEKNGKTTFEFYRKRRTGDDKDIEIMPGPITLVYAYHSTLDTPSPYRTKHDNQGWKNVTIIPLVTTAPTTEGTTAYSNTSKSFTEAEGTSPSATLASSTEIDFTTPQKKTSMGVTEKVFKTFPGTTTLAPQGRTSSADETSLQNGVSPHCTNAPVAKRMMLVVWSLLALAFVLL